MTTLNPGAEKRLSGSPGRYYAWAIAYTWAVWIPLVSYTNILGDVTRMDLPLWLRITLLLILQLGAYGPSIVALVLSARRFGGDGVGSLLSKLTIWRVGAVWYAVVLCLPAAIQVIALLMFAGLGGDVGEIDPSRWQNIGTSFFILLLFGPLAEELGWRGYALPRLLQRHSAWRASMIMAAMATLWHIPLFFSTFPPFTGVQLIDATFLVYIGYTAGRCVLYTWIFQNTRQSVLMTVLFHAAGNAAFPLALFPALSSDDRSAILLLSSVPMWIVAGLLLWRFGGASLMCAKTRRSLETIR